MLLCNEVIGLVLDATVFSPSNNDTKRFVSSQMRENANRNERKRNNVPGIRKKQFSEMKDIDELSSMIIGDKKDESMYGSVHVSEVEPVNFTVAERYPFCGSPLSKTGTSEKEYGDFVADSAIGGSRL